MRVAFYAPLKTPSHKTPSGDRRVGRLLLDALRQAGHEVDVASGFRSFCAATAPDTQADIRAAGEAEAARLVSQYKSGVLPSPEAWFTYHVYYKAPDWLGPHISRALGIPYVIAEASHAPKRANGPWGLGHDATEAAIRAADAVVNLTRADMAMVGPLVADPERMVYLPPFLDPAPFVAACENRAAHRHSVAAEFGLDPEAPWILAVAMMRDGPKLESYRLLAKALGFIRAAPWRLLIVGDGPVRARVHAALEPLESASESDSRGLVSFAGACAPETLPGLYAASDLYVWPAVHEAYGMAMLEAQAAGIPVVAGRVRGVPDVVEDGVGGLLAPEEDAAALARLVEQLLQDGRLRRKLGSQGQARITSERTVGHAARILARTLKHAQARHHRRGGQRTAP
ncbi:MAG: glycosyltransferase family 4 protein [Proteobacteria bacterium]|nr:glycosyltransferase family 4 protein [Pseudomonadota bacterium]